jgi:hypothetical protein
LKKTKERSDAGQIENGEESSGRKVLIENGAESSGDSAVGMGARHGDKNWYHSLR